MKEVIVEAVYPDGEPRILPMAKGELINESKFRFTVQVKAYNSSLDECKKLLGRTCFTKDKFRFRYLGEEDQKEVRQKVIVSAIPEEGEDVGKPWGIGWLIEETAKESLVEMIKGHEENTGIEVLGIHKFHKDFFDIHPFAKK